MSKEKNVWSVLSVLLLALLAAASIWSLDEFLFSQQKSDGFTDTPFQPYGKWRVHDANRPLPPVVTPGTPSTQEQPGKAPSDAIVLFDGSDLSHWLTRDRQGNIRPAAWKVENGYIEVMPRSGSIFSKEKFGDCQIHIEWATPAEITGSGQGRGNSGIMIMGRYEIQVLDSYENITYADGQAGAMYGQYPPRVNASRPPGEWQTYDIIFEAPKFEGSKLVKKAYVTVFHNGVLLHHRQPFLGQVVWKQVATYQPHESEGHLLLQDHGDKVRFRNIWVRRLGSYDGSESGR